MQPDREMQSTSAIVESEFRSGKKNYERDSHRKDERRQPLLGKATFEAKLFSNIEAASISAILATSCNFMVTIAEARNREAETRERTIGGT